MINNNKYFLILPVFIAIILLFNILAYHSFKLSLILIVLVVLIILIFYFLNYNGIFNTLFFSIVFLLPFNIEVGIIKSYHAGGLSGNITLSVIYILLLAWLGLLLIQNKGKILKEKMPIELLFFLLLILTGFISFAFAINKIAYFYVFNRYIFGLLLIYLVIKLDKNKMLSIVSLGLALSLIIQFAISTYQFLYKKPLGLFLIGENTDPFRKGVEGIEKGVSGTLGHPATLGIFLVLTIPLLLAYLTKSSFNVNKGLRIIVSFIFLLAFVFTLLTNARTSISLLFVSVIIYSVGNIMLKYRNKDIGIFDTIKLFIITLGFVLLFYFSFDLIYDRFFNSDLLKQVNDRNNLSDLAISIIKSNYHNLFFGVGLNNYVDVISTFGNESVFAYVHPVHNYYLLLLAEGGIFHLLAFILLYISMIIKMLKVFFKGNKPDSILALSVLTGIISILIFGFTDWGIYHNQLFFITIIYIILSIKIYSSYKNNL
ncbi:MAG: O-antigen ligase family protein [Bacillota bacterium]